MQHCCSHLRTKEMLNGAEDDADDDDNDDNFIYPGKRPVSQLTKVDRLVLIGDQHTRIHKMLT